MVPLLKITYRNCSPFGPTTVVPDGTPVEFHTIFPVAASNTCAKLLVQRYAGLTPWKSGFCMSCTYAKDNAGTSGRLQISSPVYKLMQTVSPAVPVDSKGSL